MNFHLLRPEWLWALAPAVALVMLLWRSREQRGNWRSVIDPALLEHLVRGETENRSRNLVPVIALAWLLAVIAAAGPSWQKIPQPVHQKQDALVILLDLSYSMKSPDLKPSRLDRALQKVRDLLTLRREGQTGLIAYAGDAHIVTPLTDDTLTIANLLPALNPDMMPVLGSNTAAAVKEGINLMHSAGIRQGDLLLITDEVGTVQQARVRDQLRGSGMRLTILGVGTNTGAPIPVNGGGFLKDKSGSIVTAALDEAALRSLAGATNGHYLRLQADDADVRSVLSRPPLTDGDVTLALGRTADQWADQGHWFVLALLPIALGLFRRGWLLTLVPLVLMLPPQPVYALDWDDLWARPDQQGQRALEDGNAALAAELFENKNWAGTAAYKNEDYDAAAAHFSSHDSADNWYNRGNALARAGKLDEAAQAYRESLQRDPKAKDAQQNLALIEALQAQQQQQQNQSGDGEQGEGEQNDTAQPGQESQQGDGSEQNQDAQHNENPDQQSSGKENDSAQSSDAANGKGSDEQHSSREQGHEGASDDSAIERQDSEQPQTQSQSDQEESPNASDSESKAQAAPQGRGEEEQNAGAMSTQERDPDAAHEREVDQAMQQWLRRVPDDPSGLLREKFRYESRRRQAQGADDTDEGYW